MKMCASQSPCRNLVNEMVIKIQKTAEDVAARMASEDGTATMLRKLEMVILFIFINVLLPKGKKGTLSLHLGTSETCL